MYSPNEFYNLFWQLKVVKTKHFTKQNYLSFLYVTERWNYWILCKITVKGVKVLETLPFSQYMPVKPGGQLQV